VVEPCVLDHDDVTYQTFSESEVRQRGSITLVSGDDFGTMVLPHPDTEVGGTRINFDSGTVSFSSHGQQIQQGEVGCGVMWLHR